MSPLIRLALPVLAVAGSAYAACSASATMTIQNSGDASAIATCKTFTGDIAIQTDAPGPIAIDGVQKIDGSLIVKDNSDLQQISADSLESISKDFTLSEVQRLNAVNFPKLKTVGALRWIGLPNLQNLGFDAEITKADVINIENTQLQSLEGINVETIKSMFVANNLYINSVDMQLGNVSESLTLSTNNPEVNVTFPNLMWAFNITFRNCSSVEVPSLERLNHSLNLIGNVFESFSAPNLTEVGGALAIASNFELKNISFPLLTEIGANLQIANNTKLSQIVGLPKLKSVGGALDMNGNITKIDLKALSDVRGAFNIQSTGDIQETCDNTFKPMKGKGKIQGEYKCVGEVADPGGEGHNPTKTGGQPQKTGAASALDVKSNALLFGVAAAFFL